MSKTIKISKREIKEDKFTTFVLQAKDYVTEQWVYFAGGAAVLIVAVLIVSFLKSSAVKNEQQAVEIYNRAMGEMAGKNYQLAIVDFKTVVDQYGSTSQGEMALFNLANAYLESKNFSDAKSCYERYLSKYSDDEFFTTSALAGVAACLAGEGDAAGAAEKYREAAEKYPKFQLAGEYYYQALYYYVKSGNLESAKVMLATINKDFPGSRYAREGPRLASEHNIVL
jgi:outer membrane protein assembly factor BamD (BamD/ComL family)